MNGSSRRSRITVAAVQGVLARLEVASAQDVAREMKVDRHFIAGFLSAMADLGLAECHPSGQLRVYTPRRLDKEVTDATGA